MEKVVNLIELNPDSFYYQNYSSTDESLIVSFEDNIVFNSNEDYLEYFIYDLNKNILYQNTAGYSNYQIQDNKIVIDPQQNLESLGYTEGKYYTLYNFLTRKLDSSPSSTFFIKNISSNRTEIELNNTSINETVLIQLLSSFQSEIIGGASGSYNDFYLNFGSNKLIIANNINFDANLLGTSIYIKLYEPLPDEFNIGSKCWIVERVANSKAYQIELTTLFEFVEPVEYIKGPNFNLSIQDQVNNSTPYYNQTNLLQNTSILGSGSLLYQLNSILAEKGIEIEIDYSNYSNFIHFSSAQTRLENFYYKLALIEDYTANNNLSNLVSSSLFPSSSQNIWNNKINDIITNFDGYEYYLYFSSESHAWPKTNSTIPYTNYSVNSTVAQSWFASQSISASYYDSENKDALINTIPTYLRDDSNNDQYSLFIQMIGQHFDNVWVYIKDVSNKFNADNRLNFGISKDIVAQAIRDLGVKIYQNNFSSGDIYSALLGLTISGSNLNIPNITGSLPVPSGSGLEYINTVITASSPNALEPLDDINKEIYKRIYHNLPVLLKKKGTPEGLQLLLNIYGVPETLLRINEFGGKTTRLTNDWDNFVDQFNYEFFTTSSGYVEVPLLISTGSGGGIYGSASYGGDFYSGDSFNGGITSSFSIEFRFKTTGIPTDPNAYNQVIAYAPENDLLLALEYTGSGYTSGSYNGSIPDPYNTWGTLKFIELSTGISSSLYLPFFNGNWWSVMYNFNDTTDWILETGYWDDNGIWINTESWLD